MDDMFRREIISFCNLRFSGRFFMSLCFHNLCTFITKLDTCCRMDRIVDASMTRHKTSKHLAVRRIYDRIYGKSCNISPPERYLIHILDRLTWELSTDSRKLSPFYNSFLFCFFL